MVRLLANWEVESELTLSEAQPFERYEHPQGTYTVFLRNIQGTRNELTYLSMQLVFTAPSLQESKDRAAELAKEFLDYLTFASSLKIRLRNLLHIWDWETPGSGPREGLYYSSPTANSAAPFSVLDQNLLQTVSMLQAHSSNPRFRRALKWYANGVASPYRDDQFAYFWFVIEVVAQISKEVAPVPDKCPKCHTPLYCPACEASHLHRPYPKQAIEQLFFRTVHDHPQRFYELAAEARNRLMHGDEIQTIEASLKFDFSTLVDTLGKFAWTVLFNQFVPSLMGKNPMFLRPNQFVAYNLSGVAHVKTVFSADFDDPNPVRFPKIDISFNRFPALSNRLPPSE